jgi:4-hydroxy-2-oxoheptanedioate aldolase
VSGSERTAEVLSSLLRDPERELVGTVVSSADLAFAEIAAGLLDLIWIDLEHSALSSRDVQALAIAAAAGGAYSLIRLPALDCDGVGALLDIGSDGVVLPRVEAPEDLEQAARALRYPPLGRRGFAPRRFGLSRGAPDLRSRPACIVQVESAQAVSRAAALAAHEVCDALVVGTSDLSLDIEAPPGLEDPRLGEAIRAVRDAALASGKGWGVAAGGSPADLRRLAGEGGGTLVYGSDIRIFTEALSERVGAIRDSGEMAKPRGAPG